MTHVSMEDLLQKVDSKYRLIIIAAKRTRQLNRGATPWVPPKGRKPTYVALDEVAAGKIEYTMTPVEEVTKTGVLAEAVKPTWFREIAPEGVATEEEIVEEEEEEVRELEVAPPAEAEVDVEPEEAPAATEEAELVDLDQIEGGKDEEEEG